MKRKTFSELNVQLLSIDDLYSLVKSTGDRVMIVFKTLPYYNLNELLISMVESNEKMGLHANIQARCDLTDQLIEMNIARILSFEEIKKEINFYLKHTESTHQEAALILQEFFEPFRKAHNDYSNSRSEIYYEIIMKYRSSPYLIDAVSILGFEMVFTNLESMNAHYDSIHKIRSSEISKHEFSGNNLKPDVLNFYLEFCNTIEQLANNTSFPEIISLFNIMDELRKTYPVMLEKRNIF